MPLNLEHGVSDLDEFVRETLDLVIVVRVRLKVHTGSQERISLCLRQDTEELIGALAEDEHALPLRSMNECRMTESFAHLAWMVCIVARVPQNGTAAGCEIVKQSAENEGVGKLQLVAQDRG